MSVAGAVAPHSRGTRGRGGGRRRLALRSSSGVVKNKAAGKFACVTNREDFLCHRRRWSVDLSGGSWGLHFLRRKGRGGGV